MLTQILTIARNTFIEALRQPIFFVLVLVVGILQVINTWSAAFTMGMSDSAEVSGDNKLLLDVGLATVLVGGVLLAAFTATAVVSREIQNKTVLTVVSKPVSRTSVILGKYAGVSGAILIAVVVMLLTLLLGIRHGVMSTAADSLDGPVLTFGLAALAFSILIALWCNYFYGWPFTQTAMLLLLPAMALAYLLVLLISKKWEVQPITKDLKPQVLTACAALTIGILVLTSVATAVSTRLGQVMTIVVCAGFLILGLLSNHFFGRRAFANAPVATIGSVAPADPTATAQEFITAGEPLVVTFDGPSAVAWKPGDSFYFGPSPNGFPMLVPAFPPFRGDLNRPADLEAYPGGLLVASAESGRVTIRNVGDHVVPRVPPEPGFYIFSGPTRVRPFWFALWGIVPNIHRFWLVDAVTQNQRVPAYHLGLIAAYGAANIGVYLALGICLFQRRDVG